MSFTGGYSGGVVGGFAGGSSGVGPTPVVVGVPLCGCASLCLCPARFHLGGDYACRMSGIMDFGRDIAAQLGLRPYRVSFVHVRWTGPKRGDGIEEVVTQRDILPRPSVTDMSGLVRELTPSQIDEAGTILITKISAAYSEDQILCRPSTGRPLPLNEAVYYEVQLGASGERRRLVPVGGGAPTFKPVGGWSVAVTIQSGARGRSGANRL